MPHERDDLNISAILALTTVVLTRGSYRVVRDMSLGSFPGERALLAEDDFSVVGIVAYESWSQLEVEWPEAQADLVALLGRKLARSAPKLYDAYLVLFCLSSPPSGSIADEIERDTNRVRKIVASGSSLRTTADVERVLDPFLPLEIPPEASLAPDVLDSLPDLLRSEVEPKYTQAVINAFRDLQPPLERLNAVIGASS